MEQGYNSILGERLPGRGPQGINEASTTQRYEIGARLAIKDRVYRYAHVIAGGTGLTAGWGASNIGTLRERAADLIVVGGAVGTRQLTLKAEFPVALNEFAGGFIMGGSDVAPGQSIMVPVLSNTAAVAAADSYTVILEHGLTGVLDNGGGLTIVGNIWANVDITGVLPVGSAGFHTVVGLPTINVVADSYTWLQTWGMCIVVGAEATGDTVYERTVQFDVAGSIQRLNDFTAPNNIQIAGVLATMSRYIAAPGGVAGNHSGNTIILMLFP